MNYLENFGVLKGVGVNAFKFFGVGAAGVFKQKKNSCRVGATCDSVHLWSTMKPVNFCQGHDNLSNSNYCK